VSAFKLDRALKDPSSADRPWVRPPSKFRDWISSDGSTQYPAERGRYHLYVSWACPWAHRTIIGRRLKGLEDVIGASFVDPIRDERGWTFTGGEYTDQLHGWQYLSEAYSATDPSYEGRFSTPTLWDERTGRIVNNESADILRMMSTGFGELASDEVDLVPDEHLEEIDALNKRTYETVNNAVYRAGFERDQRRYEAIVEELFASLDELDARLAGRRYLFGDAPVETDWRLFVTLVRFDAIYYIHFKCSRKRIADYPNLWPYARDLYQEHGIADTVKLDECREHYYRTQASINPKGIVAVQPQAVDFTLAHDRRSLAPRELSPP
jgi:glutathionyl-hydroquinone reductase